MEPLWRAPASRIAQSHLTALSAVCATRAGERFDDYASLHRWSVADAPAFWDELWTYAGVIGDRGSRLVDSFDRMPGARFFPDARINFAENLLRRRDDEVAIIATTEHGREATLTFADVASGVARAAAALRQSGVRRGDRVAGLVCNTAETVIAALGCAAIGAVWSGCSPEFGVDGVVDRFGQIAPRVLITVDGYTYGGKWFDATAKVAAIQARLPTLTETVVIPMGSTAAATALPSSVVWDDWLARGQQSPLQFDRGGFNDPLYILYSSGTTGMPKAIVHGAGGTLLQHLKEHQVHCDVHRGDRLFYFTTCGWMMWHWLVSGLASEATIVLYDGSPAHPSVTRLLDLADTARLTFFGTSARFLDALAKSGVRPRETHDLRTVRTIASTGSPLAPETFEFVYREIKSDVHLTSISGGSDIVGCFVLGNPNGAVWAGEIQAAGLAMDVRVFDENGQDLAEGPGELVCATPFPSMPLGFWNDPDGRRYRAAYFERFPGVWHHGDWIRRTAHGGYVIEGRSDATLNPGGVRIGTAEIYREVQHIPEVLESLAVAQQWQGDQRIVLFVRLRPGLVLDDELRKRIADIIRRQASPRHVPGRIVQVADLPRTMSGKLVELAVKRVIHGQLVPNRDAIANPESLEQFRNIPELES
jgi:acetoacetyl-CoA synthetase